MRPKLIEKRGRRGIYVLPNLFTSGNLFCGFYAILSAFDGRFVRAAIAILVAGVFDLLDGKVARFAGANSKFGIEYDSLADLVSFGLAPALLVFWWALRPYGRVGWLAAFLFLACGALRLARFNVQTTRSESKFFVGLPIPAAAYMIALTVLLHYRLFWTRPYHVSLLVTIYFLAFLMVSNIRYFSLKEFDLLRKKPFKSLVTILLGIVVILADPEIMLFLVFGAYVLSGPAQLLFLLGRRHWTKKILPSREKEPVGE
jgi:CDP-diacylglycerol--serine O-phosphatidyltransferase